MEPVEPPLLASATAGWHQMADLCVALALSTVVGVEREIRLKDAGLRTHALVGLGAALFMVVSKYGFTDVLQAKTVVVDPSRVAAQIVSGIGFIGAGLIFVKRESVRGLTTAAVGACAGAGLLVLAAFVTGLYLVVTIGLEMVRSRLPHRPTSDDHGS